MTRPPLVAITATVRLDQGMRRVRLNAAYTTAVEAAGAVPLVLPPLDRLGPVERMLDAADALLLTGGEDVDPERYGAPRHPTVEVVNPVRDATEIALVEAARERMLPTLAICRGIQLLNVAFGGSLVQDIASERPDSLPHDRHAERAERVHDLEIEPASRLARALGTTRLAVNSLHHQAVDRVAEGLRATAWAPDGIIEGLEWVGDDRWWAVGAQWHPEELVAGSAPSPDHGLFRTLVAEAGRTPR